MEIAVVLYFLSHCIKLHFYSLCTISEDYKHTFKNFSRNYDKEFKETPLIISLLIVNFLTVFLNKCSIDTLNKKYYDYLITYNQGDNHEIK